MITRPRILLVSTADDVSLKLFYSADSSQLLDPSVIYYNASDDEINKALQQDYQFIYFRDPFNDKDVAQYVAQNTTDKIIEAYPSAYFVDHITSYDDLFFEDKWRQYKLFPEFMPLTELLTSTDSIDFKKHFIKKRISSRSRDIIFSENDFPSSAISEDYIVQPLLSIEKEYRVCMVGDEIINPMAIKTSKSIDQQVKVIGIEKEINPAIIKICKVVYERTKFDLVGLDIAKTSEGFILIEVNRSCHFTELLRKSGINLATVLSQRLLSLKNNS
jgi:glutathione synthase/RimK-type ligase-like ATP-grasp enzyme